MAPGGQKGEREFYAGESWVLSCPGLERAGVFEWQHVALRSRIEPRL